MKNKAMEQHLIEKFVHTHFTTELKTVHALRKYYGDQQDRKGAVNALIFRGLSNYEIQKMLTKTYKGGAYSLREISWIRSELTKQGFRVKTSRQVRAKGGVKWRSLST